MRYIAQPNIHNTIQEFKVSKECITFIQQGCIKYIKTDSKGDSKDAMLEDILYFFTFHHRDKCGITYIHKNIKQRY